MREFNFSINEISTIYETRASIDSEISLSLLTARLLKNSRYLQPELFEYLKNLHEENKKHILSLYDITEHFTVSRF